MTTATGKIRIWLHLALAALLFALRAMNIAAVAAFAATVICGHGRLSRRVPLLAVLAYGALC